METPPTCKPEARLQPVVDRNRCEGKGDCERVCPFRVFEVRRMTDGDYDMLSFLGKIKSRAHGRRTAYMPRVDACEGCGQCVKACPEDAIQLRRRP